MTTEDNDWCGADPPSRLIGAGQCVLSIGHNGWHDDLAGLMWNDTHWHKEYFAVDLRDLDIDWSQVPTAVFMENPT